jgi:hypothetical protein
MARRKGDDWFVGSITNNDARAVPLRLDFLPAGRRFEATIYADDARATTRPRSGSASRRCTARC